MGNYLIFQYGIDYGFLNRRISGSIDVYKAKTTDVLVSRALPTTQDTRVYGQILEGSIIKVLSWN